MAATIEDFLVSLKFATDQGSYHQFLNTIEAVTAKFTKVGATVVGVTSGITLFAEKMAEAGDKLYWSSQRLGDSISNLTAFSSAMSTLGMSSGQAMQNLERFGQWMRSYGPNAAEFLRSQLGVTSSDPRTAMQQAALALNRMGLRQGMQGTQAYAQAYQWLSVIPGLDEQTVLAAPQIEARRQAMLAVQAKVWGGLGAANIGRDQFGQLSNDMILKFAQVQEMFTNIAEKMAMNIYPAVERFLQYFLDNAGPITDFFDRLGKGLGFLVDHLVDFLKYIKEIPDAVKTLAEVFIGGAYGLKMMASPLGLVLTGLAALLLLMDDYAAYQRQTPGGPHLSHFDWGKDTFWGQLASYGKDVGDFSKTIEQFGEKHPWLIGVTGGLALLAAAFGKLPGPINLAASAIAGLFSNPYGWAVLLALGTGFGAWALGREIDTTRDKLPPSEKPGFDKNITPPPATSNAPGLGGPTAGGSLGPVLRFLWNSIFGKGGTTAPDQAGPAPYNTSMLRGGVQVASLDDSWMPASVREAVDNNAGSQSSDLYQMLDEKLQGIWDTLTDIATAAGAGTETRAPGTSIAGPGGGGGYAPAGPTVAENVPSSMEDRARMLMGKVMAELGISQAEAAPIVSAFLRESKGYADISRGGGPFQIGTDIDVGLAQWVGSRHRALEAFARSIGMDPRLVDTQIKFLHQELLTNPAFRNWLQVLRSANPEAWGDMYEAGGRRSWYNHGNYTDWLTHMNLNSPGGGKGAGQQVSYNITVNDTSGDPHRTAQLTADAVRRVHQDQFRYTAPSYT